MKKIKTGGRTNSRGITRREFVRRALAIGIISGAPAFLRGENLNNKLNIAFIGCGGRANASLAELTVIPGRSRNEASRKAATAAEGLHPDEDVTVLCDLNDTAFDSASQR